MDLVLLSCPPQSRDVEESGQLNYPGIGSGFFFLLVSLATGQDLEFIAVWLSSRPAWV